MEKKTSIIVPVYNAGKYLEDCLNSLLGQSDKNIEIILVDDGSEDGSDQICRKAAEKDHRVICLFQSHAGASAARNHGLDCCTGDYVSFVDADDLVSDQYVETLRGMIDHMDADVAVVRFTTVAGLLNSGPATLNIYEGKEQILVSYLDKLSFTGCTAGKMYRRSVVEDQRYECSLKRGEDSLFFESILCKVNRIAVQDLNLYYYRMHSGSVTHQKMTTETFEFWKYREELYRIWLEQCPQISPLIYKIKNLHYADIIKMSSFMDVDRKEKRKIRKEYHDLLKNVEWEEVRKATSFRQNIKLLLGLYFWPGLWLYHQLLERKNQGV